MEHILQRIGLLTSFGVAKVVQPKELEELKQWISEIAKNESEAEEMFEAEMKKLAQMGTEDEAVPGVVIPLTDVKKTTAILKMGKVYSAKLKKLNWSKDQLCFFLLSIVNELNLSQSDFDAVIENDGIRVDDGEDDDDDEESD